MTPAVQYQTTPLIARLSPASSQRRAVAGSVNWLRSAGHPNAGAETYHELRMNPDHPMGAGQG